MNENIFPVSLSHDTHRISVFPSPPSAPKKRRVSSWYGHYSRTYHALDASCQTCRFSDSDANWEVVCTVKMSIQVKCEKLLTGECCHGRNEPWKESCPATDHWYFARSKKDIVPPLKMDDGTIIPRWRYILPIRRVYWSTVPVPANWLCHLFERKSQLP